jgi:phospholipase C
MEPGPIKHVVVLMLENHSFDQMLGSMPDVDGVDGGRSNRDTAGREYFQTPITATSLKDDPMHDLPNVLRQLEGDNANFVLDFSEAYSGSSAEERQQIMGYYTPGELSALHALAQHFTVCDRWYSSVPGPTWANRFFVHSGTSNGFVTMPTASPSRRSTCTTTRTPSMTG